MKTLNQILVLFIVCISLFSCSKDDIKYSCDDTTDQWVKSNLKSIETYTRENTLKLEPEKMRATFRAFSTNQRYQFWQAKLAEVVSMNIWSAEELAHLYKLKDEVLPEWFSDDFKKDSVKVSKMLQFKEEWIIEAQSRFVWTKKLIGGIIASGYKLKNKLGDLEISSASPSKLKSAASESTCSCNSSDDWCANQSGHDDTCKTGKCTTTSWGCGFLFLSGCNGICSYL